MAGECRASGTSRRALEPSTSGAGAPACRDGQKWRSCARAMAWNVRVMTPGWPSAATRAPISRAALSVKVTSSILDGSTVPDAMACAARRLMTRVLPEPAPARMTSGPLTSRTASAWAVVRSAKMRGSSATSVTWGMSPSSGRAAVGQAPYPLRGPSDDGASGICEGCLGLLRRTQRQRPGPRPRPGHDPVVLDDVRQGHPAGQRQQVQAEWVPSHPAMRAPIARQHGDDVDPAFPSRDQASCLPVLRPAQRRVSPPATGRRGVGGQGEQLVGRWSVRQGDHPPEVEQPPQACGPGHLAEHHARGVRPGEVRRPLAARPLRPTGDPAVCPGGYAGHVVPAAALAQVDQAMRGHPLNSSASSSDGPSAIRR